RNIQNNTIGMLVKMRNCNEMHMIQSTIVTFSNTKGKPRISFGAVISWLTVNWEPDPMGNTEKRRRSFLLNDQDSSHHRGATESGSARPHVQVKYSLSLKVYTEGHYLLLPWLHSP